MVFEDCQTVIFLAAWLLIGLCHNRPPQIPTPTPTPHPLIPSKPQSVGKDRKGKVMLDFTGQKKKKKNPRGSDTSSRTAHVSRVHSAASVLNSPELTDARSAAGTCQDKELAGVPA